jgi:hypothetical protein
MLLCRGDNIYECSIDENGIWCYIYKVITFTFEGKEYQAKEGMTWWQFINTAYNDGTFTAVRDTDNSAFPRERDVMKFETLPPGHAATRIIPRAIIGERMSPIAKTRRNVNAGSRMSWHIIPVMIDFGFVIISRNVLGLMPSATPKITIARTTLRRVEPPLIVTSIASMLS